MDLREFISRSLQDVIGGIIDAQTAVQQGKSDAVVSPQIRPNVNSPLEARGRGQDVSMVHFDIAVSATTSGNVETAAKTGLKVFALGGADLSAQGTVGHERGHETRIAFQVPIALPRVKPEFESI